MQAQRQAAEIALRQAEGERGATLSARQRAAQLEEEMSQKLQEAARERETLLQQLQALQQSAHPPPPLEEVGIICSMSISFARPQLLGPVASRLGEPWSLSSQIAAVSLPHPIGQQWGS